MIQYFLLALSALIISCGTKINTVDADKAISEQQSISTDTGKVIDLAGHATKTLGKNIQYIFQDNDGFYWFGTQNEGVYRYDPSVSFKKGGNPLILLTEKDGLSNNQIQTIQEDKYGNIWLSTGGFGISRFDSNSISTLTGNRNITGKRLSKEDLKLQQDQLWFNAGAGVYRYTDNALTYLTLADDYGSLQPQYPANRLSQYAVYCTLIDKKGNLWCGTQSMGVCRFSSTDATANEGTWLTQDGLAGPAVLALFEDKNGIIWIGTNGSGLFRFDPSTNILSNFTKENKLENEEFRKTGKSVPGTIARIYSINEDHQGNLWIGTVDSGAWRYDGKQLKNFTTKDGLSSNAVTCIYKDKKGELWFGTENDVCTFNGKNFSTFVIN